MCLWPNTPSARYDTMRQGLRCGRYLQIHEPPGVVTISVTTPGGQETRHQPGWRQQDLAHVWVGVVLGWDKGFFDGT